MKIGVFLSKRISTEGGGYTITEEIVDALILNINQNKSQSDFFFLINNDKDNLICSKLKKNKISYRKISESKSVKIIFTFISHFFKWSNFLLNSLNILKITRHAVLLAVGVGGASLVRVGVLVQADGAVAAAHHPQVAVLR